MCISTQLLNEVLLFFFICGLLSFVLG
jgi:hypothetical protein